jgi:ABC-type antimicrobial peptide transport system permease subunit
MQVKSNYTRLFVIGYSKKKVIKSLIKEGLILLCIFFVTSMMAFIIVAYNFADLGILFGEYEPIKFNGMPILYGGIIITVVFAIQYAIYIYKVLHIKISEIIKAY